jgi:hypothetical protein
MDTRAGNLRRAPSRMNHATLNGGAGRNTFSFAGAGLKAGGYTLTLTPPKTRYSDWVLVHSTPGDDPGDRKDLDGACIARHHEDEVAPPRVA